MSNINALTNAVTFTNGHELLAGGATGDVHELALRRIQFRVAVKAHFEKEHALFAQGIKEGYGNLMELLCHRFAMFVVAADANYCSN